MAQDNVFGHLLPGSQAAQPTVSRPRAPGVIPGTPDPTKAAAEARAQAGEQRAAEDQARQAQNDTFNRDDKRFANVGKLRDDWNKLPEVKTYRVALGQLGQALDTGAGPQSDLALTYAFAKAMDPESVVREAEQQMITESQPWFQAAVERTKKQFGMDGAGNYTPETRAAIRQQIINSVAQRRKIYGQLRGFHSEVAKRYNYDPYEVVGPDDGHAYFERFQQYDKQRKGNKPSVETSGGLPVGTQIQFGSNTDPFDRAGYVLKNYGITPDQEAMIVGFFNQNQGNANLTPENVASWYQQNNIPVPAPEALNSMVDSARKGYAFGGVDTTQAEEAYMADIKRVAAEQDKALGPADNFDLARQGYTLNLQDESAGIGAAIGAALTGNDPIKAYQQENQAYDYRLNQARERGGALGTAVEFTGALASGGNALNAAPMTVREAAGTGAALGGLYGFGSGEGLVGSTGNALLGAAIGGTVGGGVQMGANKLESMAANRATANAADIQRATEGSQAAAAEGITYNRAMADPNARNRVTGVDASIVGGPKFQRGMQQIEGQIENRVGQLGQGGNAMNAETAGNTYRAAGERFIKDSRKDLGAKYEAAKRAAGDAKVAPINALSKADAEIARLKETPGINEREIAYLEKIRSDLTKPLSVDGLRSMRTKMRKEIAKGDLVFGEDEARILGIMDSAADDLADGLAQQGKGAAAKLFKQADTDYRARQEYITATLQKIIGKRNSTLSADQVAKNLTGMVKGKDTNGVREFMARLTPDEKKDVAATFANALGRSSPDEPFSVATFLSNTKERDFPEGAMRVIFGDEGAASIKRLRIVSRDVKDVTSAMNSRKSGTGVANDWRSWLFNSLVGAGGAGAGIAMQSPGVIAAAAVPAAAKATRDIISARALLSADISKWIAAAPRTTNPAAINAHMAKLSAIASGNSMARMDAKAIEEYLKGVAAKMAQSPGQAAAQNEDNGRVKPPQQ
jgi:hypothetical protein